LVLSAAELREQPKPTLSEEDWLMPVLRHIAFAAAAAGLVGLGACETMPNYVGPHTEGDAESRLVQHARMMAPPGTFWLDSNDDREIVRYTTPRDVSLCQGEGSIMAEEIPIRVTWDGTNTAILYPGNCLYFDARQVVIRPAERLPPNVTLRGRVETASALVQN
jgi:hypothetical protein